MLVSLRYMYTCPITTILHVATHPSWEEATKRWNSEQQTDSKSKANQRTLPRIAVANPTALHRQKACSRSLPQVFISRQRKITSKKVVTCQNHLTQLFFVKESLQERTAHMMRKRAEHEVLHTVLTCQVSKFQVCPMMTAGVGSVVVVVEGELGLCACAPLQQFSRTHQKLELGI